VEKYTKIKKPVDFSGNYATIESRKLRPGGMDVDGNHRLHVWSCLPPQACCNIQRQKAERGSLASAGGVCAEKACDRKGKWSYFMKRFFSILLALCLLSTALYGCGKKEDKKENSSGPASSAVVSKSPATPEPVQKAKAVKIKADDGLNIRSEPSTDSEILDLAENGSKLPLLVEKPSDGWYQIEYNGKSAYVSAEYADIVEVTLEEYNQLKKGTLSSEASSDASKPDDDPGRAASSATPEPKTSSGESEVSRPSGNEDGE